ncbi:MAG: nitroreductase family protein [Actinobacteria bacterium]|nr:nitroreductase family protein [Actinomycetota bacterium]
MTSTLLEVMARQRACRHFRPDPVPWDLLRPVLTAATRAPSAENRQPWRFVVVEDGDARARIAGITSKVWEGGARSHAEASLPPALFVDVDEAASAGYGGAPALVVVLLDRDAAGAGDAGPSIWPAVQNLLIAATAEGLGSVLTTLATYLPDELREATGAPASWDPVAVIPLGYPAEPLGPSRRRALDEVAWHDRVGTPLPAGPDGGSTRS